MNGHILLALLHILVIVPVLGYIAIQRGQLPPWVFPALLGLGGVILVYHAFKLIVKWRASSPSVWVNIFHVVAVAPLLLYIGSQAYDTPRWAYELLLMETFAALGYHLYGLVQGLQTMSEKVDDLKRVSQGVRSD
jgi:hypothetical protein